MGLLLAPLIHKLRQLLVELLDVTLRHWPNFEMEGHATLDIRTTAVAPTW